MTAMLREMYVDNNLLDSNTLCANLFNPGYLRGAIDVQSDILVRASGTHLGIGPRLADDDICDIIESYGASLVCAVGNRILQLTIHCQKKERKLSPLTRILHGGEFLSEVTLKGIERSWGHRIQCFAVYGSSDAGCFALKRPDENTYSALVDGVHCEILDDNGDDVPIGTFGTLVVMILPRVIHPLILYWTGDLARFTSAARNRFEVAGRNMGNLSRNFGNIIVTWSEVRDAVGHSYK